MSTNKHQDFDFGKILAAGWISDAGLVPMCIQLDCTDGFTEVFEALDR